MSELRPGRHLFCIRKWEIKRYSIRLRKLLMCCHNLLNGNLNIKKKNCQVKNKFTLTNCCKYKLCKPLAILNKKLPVNNSKMSFLCIASQSRMTHVGLADHWFKKQHQWSSTEIDFPRKKMWWHTQHSADFGNWVSIKGLLSQREMCHVAKSSFYDAVCLVSLKACKTLARKKKNTELVDFLNGFLWCKSSQISGWPSVYSWFFRAQRGGRPVEISLSHKENTQQCCGGFTDWAMMGGTLKTLVFCLSSDIGKKTIIFPIDFKKKTKVFFFMNTIFEIS